MFALIAYEDPETSPVRQYMAEDYKDQIALRVNSAILGTTTTTPRSLIVFIIFVISTTTEHHGLAGEAALEVVLRHLAALQQVMAEGRRASGSGGSSKVRAEATRHTARDGRAADGVSAVCAHTGRSTGVEPPGVPGQTPRMMKNRHQYPCSRARG